MKGESCLHNNRICWPGKSKVVHDWGYKAW
jgi:hypothetical protein